MDKNEISALFLGDSLAKRDQWFELFKDKIFVPKYTMDWDETRDLPFKRLTKVRESGLFKIRDWYTNPKNIFLAHEMLAQVDGSTAIKFTVNYNLFGGTLVSLSSQRHEKYFDLIDSGDIVGCFCLTELGFGNNAVKMETTVEYDDKTKEFIINTPTVLSQKYWITNGFKHSNYAMLFGKTIVKGKDEGVAAFLVRTRD